MTSRLDVLAYKTIKMHPQLLQYAMEIPTVSSVIQRIKKHDIDYMLRRYIHLRLIGALLVLFKHEPDSLVTIRIGKHVLEITTYRDDQHRKFFTVQENNREIVFAKQQVFVAYMIQMLSSNRIYSIRAEHSSLDHNKRNSIYLFVHAVDDMFGETTIVPEQMFRLYQTTLQPPRGPA